jgi:hypothetical protein
VTIFVKTLYYFKVFFKYKLLVYKIKDNMKMYFYGQKYRDSGACILIDLIF